MITTKTSCNQNLKPTASTGSSITTIKCFAFPLIELPEYLSTHPSHANRSENLTKLLPGALDLRRSIGCDLLSSPCQNNARLEHFIATTKKLVHGFIGINNVPTKMRIVAPKE